jgi:hypothetical protein
MNTPRPNTAAAVECILALALFIVLSLVFGGAGMYLGWVFLTGGRS